MGKVTSITEQFQHFVRCPGFLYHFKSELFGFFGACQVAAIEICISKVLSQAQKKRAVAEERAEQSLVRLQGARMPMSHSREVFNFESGPIGQGVHF